MPIANEVTDLQNSTVKDILEKIRAYRREFDLAFESYQNILIEFGTELKSENPKLSEIRANISQVDGKIKVHQMQLVKIREGRSLKQNKTPKAKDYFLPENINDVEEKSDRERSRVSIKQIKHEIKKVKLERAYTMELYQNLLSALESIDLPENKKAIVCKKEIEKLEMYQKEINEKGQNLEDLSKSLNKILEELYLTEKSATSSQIRQNEVHSDSFFSYLKTILGKKEVVELFEYLKDISESAARIIKDIQIRLSKAEENKRGFKEAKVEIANAEKKKEEKQTNKKDTPQNLQPKRHMSKEKQEKISRILYQRDHEAQIEKGTREYLIEKYRDISLEERRNILRMDDETLEKLKIAISVEDKALTESEIDIRIKKYYKEIKRREVEEAIDEVGDTEDIGRNRSLTLKDVPSGIRDVDIQTLIQKLNVLLDVKESINRYRLSQYITENEHSEDSEGSEIVRDEI